MSTKVFGGYGRTFAAFVSGGGLVVLAAILALWFPAYAGRFQETADLITRLTLAIMAALFGSDAIKDITQAWAVRPVILAGSESPGVYGFGKLAPDSPGTGVKADAGPVTPDGEPIGQGGAPGAGTVANE